MRKIIPIRKFNPVEFTRRAVKFLRQITRNTKRQKVIIGLSGGVDSAVAATLAVKALDRQNVMAVQLPSKTSNRTSSEDANLVIRFLGLPAKNTLNYSIASIIKVFQKTLGVVQRVSLGNITARVRMMILFDLAARHNGLVLGTENKTENRMGYFTRFGDAASDIELINGLYKTEVWQLAKYLKIPDIIINKVPTADLWPGQTDEGEMGALYPEIDAVLRCLEFFPRASVKKISQATGVPLNKVEKIIQWLKKMQFKHEVPYTLNYKT